MLIEYLHTVPDWLMELYLILVSACIGSFLNVVIYRLPQTILNNPDFTLWTARSFCPACRKLVRWHDNIPLISYFLLKGKCRSCQKKIPLRYPLIEASTILFSLIIYQVLGLNAHMFAALLFTWWLIAMTVIDFDHFLLPDQLTLSLLWLGLLLNLSGLFTPLEDAVLGAALGYVLLFAIDMLYFLVRKRNGLGQGDWKLLAAFGAWFGWIAIFYILAFAALFGAIVGISAIIFKKAKMETALPFGPFLCVAAFGWMIKTALGV